MPACARLGRRGRFSRQARSGHTAGAAIWKNSFERRPKRWRRADRTRTTTCTPTCTRTCTRTQTRTRTCTGPDQVGHRQRSKPCAHVHVGTRPIAAPAPHLLRARLEKSPCRPSPARAGQRMPGQPYCRQVPHSLFPQQFWSRRVLRKAGHAPERGTEDPVRNACPACPPPSRHWRPCADTLNAPVLWRSRLVR